MKTGTLPPPCVRNPLRARPLADPSAVYVCGSISSARRSSSVTPSERRSSLSSVRLRAALLGAPPCVDDALPLRACREGPAVVTVAGLLVRITRGGSSATSASGSSSSLDCGIFRRRVGSRVGVWAFCGVGAAAIADACRIDLELMMVRNEGEWGDEAPESPFWWAAVAATAVGAIPLPVLRVRQRRLLGPEGVCGAAVRRTPALRLHQK
ncbi:hypothetical protein EDB83DRAFT_636512 [Lactarius deliciosus]|nr:hypothetical protein EDB83DRAFT_636512 [Lactarius deliciosus]